MTLHARIARPLLEGDGGAASPPSLTAEQQARIEALRSLARRKLRAARALLTVDLADEAMAPLREGALAHAQAASIPRRLPEPANLAESLRPPHDCVWPEGWRVAVQALDDGTLGAPAAGAIAEGLQKALDGAAS